MVLQYYSTPSGQVYPCNDLNVTEVVSQHMICTGDGTSETPSSNRELISSCCTNTTITVDFDNSSAVVDINEATLRIDGLQFLNCNDKCKLKCNKKPQDIKGYCMLSC